MVLSASTQDHYAVLEVQMNASLDQIKASYRRLALLHHPDKNEGSTQATIKTQQINAAWEVLKNPTERRKYDSQRPKKRAQHSGTTREKRAQQPQTTPWCPFSPPPPPPRSRCPSPDSSAAAEEARTAAFNHFKRQQWLNFEKAQEQEKRACSVQMRKLEAEIAQLRESIRLGEYCLRDDEPFWCSLLQKLRELLSDTERENMRTRLRDNRTAVHIKEAILNDLHDRFTQLDAELTLRRQQEEQRLEQIRLEKAARAAAEKQAQEEAQRRAEEVEEENWRQAARDQAKAREYEEKVRKEEVRRQRRAHRHFTRDAEGIQAQWQQDCPDAFDAWARADEEAKADAQAGYQAPDDTEDEIWGEEEEEDLTWRRKWR